MGWLGSYMIFQSSTRQQVGLDTVVRSSLKHDVRCLPLTGSVRQMGYE